ncbi:MAG: hypothetical protein IKZ82_12290 [Clostridia bacterium]|nr:hypothetical protein [Clostridia bacterium]
MRYLRTFKNELARSILSPRFAAAVVIMIVGLIFGGFKDLLEFLKALHNTEPGSLRFGMEQMFFSIAVNSDAAHFVLPIAAALPCSVLLIDDLTSGFIKAYVSKTGRAAYIAVRGIVSLLVPALAAALGMALFYTALYLIVSPYCMPADNGVSIAEHIMGVLRVIGLYSAGSALWSAVGLLIAGATVNSFSAVASPFILFYLMEIAFTRYFPRAIRLVPSMYLSTDSLFESPATPMLISLVLACVLIAAFSAAAYTRIRRQI